MESTKLKDYERFMQVWYTSGRKSDFVIDKTDITRIENVIGQNVGWVMICGEFVNLNNVESIVFYEP